MEKIKELTDAELIQVVQVMRDSVKIPHGVTRDYVVMSNCEFYTFDLIRKLEAIKSIYMISIKGGYFIIMFTGQFPRFLSRMSYSPVTKLFWKINFWIKRKLHKFNYQSAI